MLFIDNGGITDPRVNLALEEYALRNFDIDESYLLFYVNEPSVIIGKHQNTVEEINQDFIHERSIHVVRRISGGGAVYHDLGNLNFSFITRYDPKRFNNYAEFNGPVVRALRNLGVPAELSGRNDIVADGRKISGNAQFTTGERMFSHGTLLFDSNLDDVVRALNVKAGKIESKGIKSIRSRVANIAEFLDRPMTVEQLRTTLLEEIFGSATNLPRRELTEADREGVHRLSEAKYRTWEWNYGLSPRFNVQRVKRFGIGEIDARLDVEEGRIRNVRFFGDFFARREMAELEALLANVRYERDDIHAALTSADVSSYFAEITAEELAELLY
ncbi:MAG TPA: lipoate--protein ligase [Longimicrobium sp.]|nr:lipoate--protein ligase [Longimicrobium sp.]